MTVAAAARHNGTVPSWGGRLLPDAASGLPDEQAVYVLALTGGLPVFTGRTSSFRRRAIAYLHCDWLSDESEAFELASLTPTRELRPLVPVPDLVTTTDLLPEDEFWVLVSTARRYGTGLMAGGLRGQLAREGAEVAAGFARRWEALTIRLNSWAAWDVAYVMHGGCSDDGFEYFRSWLVTLGREAVEESMEDPLAWALHQSPTLSMGIEEGDAERMSYAPFEAYEQLTNERLMRAWPSRRRQPTGERTPEEAIGARYVQLETHRGNT